MLSQCSHFAPPEAASLFCDLVAKLHAGPAQPAQKAWNFAEHLLKTHDFFLPLRSTARAHATAQHDDWPSRESLSPSDASPSDVASDELKTISTIFGGIDPSPNSLFQRHPQPSSESPPWLAFRLEPSHRILRQPGHRLSVSSSKN